MPIKLAITQPDGTAPTYHVVMGYGINKHGSLYGSVTVESWMDADHFNSGAPSIVQTSYPITVLLQMPPAPPIPNLNFLQQIDAVVEQYLLMTPTFSGGTQV